MPATPASGYPPYRHGRGHGSSRRGRLLLIVIFCALRASDACLYFGGPADAKSRLLAGILTGALWTTALLVGVWFRQDWCRWALTVVLLLGIGAFAVLLREAFELPLRYNLVAVPALAALINGCAAWAVIVLRDIRHLTNRTFGARPYGYN